MSGNKKRILQNDVDMEGSESSDDDDSYESDNPDAYTGNEVS